MRGKRASGTKHERIRESGETISAESLNMENLYLIFEKTSWQSRIMVPKNRSNQCESKVCLQNIVIIQSKFLFGLRIIHSVGGE